MKPVYRRDYQGEAASHFMHFPQTEQSQQILAHNRQILQTIAEQASNTITSQARAKSRDNLLGGKVNIFV